MGMFKFKPYGLAFEIIHIKPDVGLFRKFACLFNIHSHNGFVAIVDSVPTGVEAINIG